MRVEATKQELLDQMLRPMRITCSGPVVCTRCTSIEGTSVLLALMDADRMRNGLESLSSGTTVPFSPEQLLADGWSSRQIVKLTGGLKDG